MSSTTLPSFVKKLFSKYLLVTNTVTCCSLLGVGDLIEQTREIRRNKKNDVAQGKLHSSHSYDWKRTGRMAAIGFMLGPINHYWYLYLDRFLPGTSGRMVLKKILLDQIVAAPFFNASFIIGIGVLEGKPLSENIENFKCKFPTLYLIDCFVWPVTQSINFLYVPSRYRVLYVNTVVVFWDIFMSYVQHDTSGSQLLNKITSLIGK
ncbi:mpv17-like protein 2 isoform X1 [Anneissia japonica]|uniref:mpv17-like protein 2 isoform X1 n=1 Tax=Anneissia japonica TaxID=1529436 RepID=UPI001425706C|nr:mpv17-like protein 2 isoform X1 [Anneissia japonica]XP_033111666.1 mpv17-like protein 2 isoform X1 [Anneissia japonica]XP_033111667.1 mpv17-like protein 2 isoform X1 [Anneissia japonica]